MSDQEVWLAVFVAAFEKGTSIEASAILADRAVEAFKKRF